VDQVRAIVSWVVTGVHARTRDGHRHQEPSLARRTLVSRQPYRTSTCNARKDRASLVGRRYDTRPRVGRARRGGRGVARDRHGVFTAAKRRRLRWQDVFRRKR